MKALDTASALPTPAVDRRGRQPPAAVVPPERILVPPGDLVRSVIHRFVDAGIAGGASYDALVGLTAMSHGLELVTRDVRAARTYEAIGADHQLLGTGE